MRISPQIANNVFDCVTRHIGPSQASCGPSSSLRQKCRSRSSRHAILLNLLFICSEWSKRVQTCPQHHASPASGRAWWHSMYWLTQWDITSYILAHFQKRRYNINKICPCYCWCQNYISSITSSYLEREHSIFINKRSWKLRVGLLPVHHTSVCISAPSASYVACSSRQYILEVMGSPQSHVSADLPAPVSSRADDITGARLRVLALHRTIALRRVLREGSNEWLPHHPVFGSRL